jgi:hypothetical protein
MIFNRYLSEQKMAIFAGSVPLTIGLLFGNGSDALSLYDNRFFGDSGSIIF